MFNHFIGALVAMYVTFGCLQYIQIKVLWGIYNCIAIGFAIAVIAIFYQKRQGLIMMTITLILVAWMFICYRISGAFGYQYRVALIIMNAALVWCLLTRNISSYWVLVPYAGFTLFYIAKFMEGVDPDAITEGMSRNAISCVILWSGSVYILVRGKEGKLWNSHVALPIIVISFLAIGRSGVIASTLLVVLMLMNELRHFHELGKEKRIWTVFLCCILLAVLVYGKNYYELQAAERFRIQGMESKERYMVIDEYLSVMDWQAIMTGYDTTSLEEVIMLNYNTHNSYINAHAAFGVLSILFFVLLLVAIIRSLFCLSVSGAVLIALSVRSLSDSVAFMNMFDFIIIYSMWIILEKINVRSILIFSSKRNTKSRLSSVRGLAV